MWDWRAVLGLEEEGLGVDCVKGAFVGSIELVSLDISFQFFLSFFQFPIRGNV